MHIADWSFSAKPLLKGEAEKDDRRERAEKVVG